jgi:uncharacterized membrane protein HdeD (DUF308 family)
MIEPATLSQVIDYRARWKWFIVLGVMLLVLGIAGISVPTLLQFTSLLVFGPVLLAGSLIQLLTAFFAEKRKEWFLHLVAAGLVAVFGFFIMANPPEVIIGLVTLLAIFLIVIGLTRLTRSLATQSPGRA